MMSKESSVLEQPEAIVKAIERLSNPDLDTVVRRAIEIRAQRNAPHLTEHETRLFAQINEGAPAEAWARYHDLRAKRVTTPLTAAEQQELVDLYEAIELQHAGRIRAVIELAQLRGEPVERLMDQLGLVSPGCE
jgi:hypothetical protein